MADAERLLEACGEHPRHALQPVPRLAVGGVLGRGRAVIQQRVVGGRLGIAALMHGQACLLEQLVHLALQQEAGGWRRRGRRVVGGAGCGGWRRGCGLAGRGHRAAAAVHQEPERTRGDQRRRQCGPDQHQPGPAAGELLIGLPRPAPEGSDGQLPRRGEGGAGCWWSLARQRLRHGAREHRLGLARLDVGRQHREYPALERGS